MKTLIILLLTFIGFSAQAQYQVNAQDNSIERMIKLYDLTTAQAAQYKTMVKDKMTAIKALDQIDLDQKARKDKLTEIDNDFNTSFEGILDDRQKKIFEIQKQMARNIKEGNLSGTGVSGSK